MSSVQIRQLRTTDPQFEADFARVLHWSAETDDAIEQRVIDAQIIDQRIDFRAPRKFVKDRIQIVKSVTNLIYRALFRLSQTAVCVESILFKEIGMEDCAEGRVPSLQTSIDVQFRYINCVLGR